MIEDVEIIFSIIASVIVILTFIVSFIIYIFNYFKPKVRFVNLDFSNDERIKKKYPTTNYLISWPLLSGIKKKYEEGYEKAYLWIKLRKYEFQIINEVPFSNHILMVKKL